MTIAYRASIDQQTRRRSHDVLIDSPDTRLQSPEGQAEHREECTRLNASIDALPPQYREVLVLHYTGGLTLQQTAEAMDISLGTVKSRLNTAARKAQECAAMKCENFLRRYATGNAAERLLARLHAARCPECAARRSIQNIAQQLSAPTPLTAAQRRLWEQEPTRSCRAKSCCRRFPAHVLAGAWLSPPVCCSPVDCSG